MPLVVADVAREVQYLLQDTDGARWTPAQLAVWIAECHTYLASIAPAVCIERAPVAVATGGVQSLPATILQLGRILGVCDSNGVVSSSITEISDKELFLEQPAWMSSAAGTPLHFAKATGDKSKYYLYPPQNGSGYVLMDYVSVPVDPDDIDWTDGSPTLTQINTLDAELLPVVVDYVMYRAFGIDADNISNMALSDKYFDMFASKLAAYASAMGAGEITPPKAPRQRGGNAQ